MRITMKTIVIMCFRVFIVDNVFVLLRILYRTVYLSTEIEIATYLIIS